jgi:hypothetical protein
VKWLTRNTVPYVLVFTKTDRGTPESVQANIAAFTAAISGWFEKLPQIFQCSSMTGQGRSDLLEVINATLEAGPAEEAAPPTPAAPLPPDVQPPFSLKVRAGSSREKAAYTKRQLKMARPW